jgi:signal transduction histidine kinase/CheY-like chemotaxis protein
MKKVLLLLFCLALFKMQAQENIDSLILSWNKISDEFIKVNENDSACKYGNCAVERMDLEINSKKNTTNKEELINLKKKKAQALSNLVTANGNSDRMDLAMECYQSALQIYKDINEPFEIFNLHTRMARVNELRSSYNESLKYYHKALDQAIINNDKKSQALCYNLIGIDNRLLGNYPEALKNHFEDLRIHEELNDKVGIANAYVTLAAILNKLNDREAAIEKLSSAQKLFEEVHDTTGIATVYNDLGSTYNTMGDTMSALQNHLQAAKLRELCREFNGLGTSNSYIAKIYLQKGDYIRASNYLKKADKAFQKASNRQGIMTTQIEMSGVYLDKYDLDSAFIWLDIAENTATEIMNYQGLIDIYSSRGKIWLLKNNPDLSIKNFKHALSIADQQNNHQQIYLLNSYLANTYKDIGNYRDAFNYQNKSMQYKDSVNSNANFKVVVQMEMEYNYKKEKLKNDLLQEKKDELNKAKLAEQETQKKLYFTGVLMFLMVSLGLLSRLRYIRKSSKALMEQKKEAERLRSVAETEKLRATQSEKVKEQFLANMSHEIRTPMNAITGMIDILIRHDHPLSQEKYLHAIQQSSESLLVILNEILDLSKLEAGKMELEKISFEPVKILQNVLNILHFKAEEKGLKLILKTNKNIPQIVRGDPTHLHQILLNLASNAIKFTHKGRITIEANTNFMSDEKVVLQFKVIDTGIGIPKEKMDHVFDVFTQGDTDTTRKYGGTGLGLTICKRLAELHHGSISVESEINIGSAFTVEIPYGLMNDKEEKFQEEITIDAHDLNILLAEDNEFNVIVALDVLENSLPGVRIDIAENGEIAVVKVQSNRYDLILMDIQMPEMDGYEATRAIRLMGNEKANIPIIAMTANIMKAEVDRCFEAGMNAYISKPFDRHELLATINKVLEFSHSQK